MMMPPSSLCELWPPATWATWPLLLPLHLHSWVFRFRTARTWTFGYIGLTQEELPHNADGGPAGPIDLRAWFGPDLAAMARPLELEIGSGKGTFLVQQATLLPGVNFIGVEWAMQFWKFAADRCRRHELENVRLLRAEAGLFVRCYVPDQCFQQVHIYFPDPWPKTRHHKRG